MFFTSILNSGIGTNSVLSCILCSPTNVSGPQHSLEWSLTCHPTPAHGYQRKVITAELWRRMKELRGMTAAKFLLHTKALLLQAHVPRWAGSFCFVCLDIDFCTCTRAFLCLGGVNQSQVTQQPGLGFALFVALIKPSLMREPVMWLFKRAIKRVIQQISLWNPKGVINRHNEISWTLSRTQL